MTRDIVLDDRAGPALRRSQRGLDWFAFFCANLQTGFGPFVTVYLTTAKWTQTDIGFILMIGGLVGLFGQMPGGALVDRARSKRLMAALSLAVISVSAFCVAVTTLFPLILLAWIAHAAASCVLSPCMNTISLGLVGYSGIGTRLGRNATFASVGSALAAAGMGAFGYYFSNQAVFFVTAALAVPAIATLWLIAGAAAAGPIESHQTNAPKQSVRSDWKGLLTNRPLIILAASVALFHLSNAAMLPLVGSVMTLRSVHSPTLLIAACIIVPQVLVAVLSPLVGAKSQSWGRRPLLIIGFAALPIRGLCLGLVRDPNMFVVVQILDGISAATIGVIVPLVAADAVRRGGGFALAQGFLGTTMGLGASFSSTIGGFLTDHFGSQSAFFGLTIVGLIALALVILFMPETRDGKTNRSAIAPDESPAPTTLSAVKRN